MDNHDGRLLRALMLIIYGRYQFVFMAKLDPIQGKEALNRSSCLDG